MRNEGKRLKRLQNGGAGRTCHLSGLEALPGGSELDEDAAAGYAGGLVAGGA